MVSCFETPHSRHVNTESNVMAAGLMVWMPGEAWREIPPRSLPSSVRWGNLLRVKFHRSRFPVVIDLRIAAATPASRELFAFSCARRANFDQMFHSYAKPRTMVRSQGELGGRPESGVRWGFLFLLHKT